MTSPNAEEKSITPATEAISHAGKQNDRLKADSAAPIAEIKPANPAFGTEKDAGAAVGKSPIADPILEDHGLVAPTKAAEAPSPASTSKIDKDSAIRIIPSKGDPGRLPEHYAYNEPKKSHHFLYSTRGIDRKYFWLDWLGNRGYNPNIIPHRVKNDTWIIVAQQQEHSVADSIWFAEWVCEATFVDHKLKCLIPPSILPIAATVGNKCLGNLAFFGFNVGPHDARVFYGPEVPFTIFGSQSNNACFGQWMQDFRILLDWGLEKSTWSTNWLQATEILRPPPWGTVEKNWFVFWDKDGELYAHHDLQPRRTFTKLNTDGTVGPNLAPEAKGDFKCMQKFMPPVAELLESIHQATNSLSITLCNRGECTPDDSNTYLFMIFQHKSYYQFHSNYEPYVMLWEHKAPFSIYGIGQKPFWFNGRGGPGEATRPDWIAEEDWKQSEMNYVVSMSWATQGQKYHGYMDDVLFISFGVEDGTTAATDILAGELFQELGLCSTVT